MRPYAEFDTECVANWWLIKFYLPDNSIVGFELHDDKPQFSQNELRYLMHIIETHTVVGFNSLGYDLPMLKLALTGVGTRKLKELNDAIIVGRLKYWLVRETWPQAELPGLDHVDIMPVAPGVMIGLKTFMARMHSPTIQDLPFDPAALLDAAGKEEASIYCNNDVRGTRALRLEVMPRLRLREKLGARYGVDLRCKSDAQLAESMFAARLGYRPRVPHIPSGTRFKMKPAPWLRFVTPHLQHVLQVCLDTEFVWNLKEPGEVLPDGERAGVTMPAALKALNVRIGKARYTFGIGGLHSNEKSQTIEEPTTDHDVGSFYPSLMIILGLLSDPAIMRVYIDIYKERMESKALIPTLSGVELEEGVAMNEGAKIALNASFGKMWNRYSFLCNPQAGVSVTLNGQLSLLMLIEMLELGGISVVSANTDGIILLTPPHLEAYRAQTLAWWEGVTGLTTERTDYVAIYMRDVNNYLAVMPSGKVKRKGALAAGSLTTHPDCDIAKTAVVDYLTRGVPITKTVRGCHDVRQFVMSRKVKGGGNWRGKYLGGTVRWYLSTDGDAIVYANGNKVAGSDGAKPMQLMPPALPVDVDFDAYIERAKKLLKVLS